VHALGVTACEVRTGRLPHKGDSLAELEHAHLHLDPPVPRPSDERLEEVRRLIGQSLAKHPAQQPSAIEWERALHRVYGRLDASR
jgi:serine/threonine protein kinase